jgi:hypothetical protein
MSEGPIIEVTTVGSILESTPEGLHDMDNLRRAADAHEAELARLLTPKARERLAALGRESDRRMLGLAPGGPNNR